MGSTLVFKHLFRYFFLLGFFISCSDNWNRIYLTGVLSPASHWGIAEIDFSNGHLILKGEGLDQLLSVELRDGQGDLFTLEIASQTEIEVSLQGTNPFEIYLDESYQLLIESYRGDLQEVPFRFTLGDGAVSTAQIRGGEAPLGHYLGRNTLGENSRALEELNFKGIWDARDNLPDLTGLKEKSADFYIVYEADSNPALNTTLDGENAWQKGDWVILDSSHNWRRIPTGDFIRSVNGMFGEVSLTEITWPLGTLQNVETGGVLDGQVLMYDALNERWIAGDDLGAETAPFVLSIQAGTGLDGGLITTSGTLGLAPAGIASEHLAPLSIGNTQIASEGVSNRAIAPESITGAKVSNNSIGENKIANESITPPLIGDEEILNQHIEDFSVTEIKIAENQVTPSKISAQSVSTGKLANGAIGRAAIYANGAIDSNHLAANSVTGAKIATNTLALSKFDISGVGNINNVLLGDGSWGEPPFPGFENCTLVTGNTSSAHLESSSVLNISSPFCIYYFIGDYMHFELSAEILGDGETLSAIRFPHISTSPNYQNGSGNVCASTPLNGVAGPGGEGSFAALGTIVNTSTTPHQIYHFLSQARFSRSSDCSLVTMAFNCRCELSYQRFYMTQADHQDFQYTMTLTAGHTYQFRINGVVPWIGDW